MASKRSVVWDFFTEDVSKSFVVCKQCKKQLTYSGNTSNMLSHVKHRHPMIHSEVERIKRRRVHNEENNSETEVSVTPEDKGGAYGATEPSVVDVTSGSSCSSSNSIVSLETSTEVKTICIRQTNLDNYKPLGRKQQEKLEKHLAFFVAVDMLPYSLVEKQGFRQFIKALAPGFKIPGRKALTENYIPALRNSTRAVIEEELQHAQSVSITTDCWTSSANVPYVVVTVHYITGTWQLNVACLVCKELSEDHMAENLSELLIDTLEDWKIPESKLISCTTDCGSNILAAIQILKWNHVSCFGHVLNTSISKAMKLQELQTAITKIKAIQSSFAHSWKIKRELRTIQGRLGMPPKNIPSYSRTRWWSLLKLMEVIVDQHIPLLTLLTDYQKGKYRQHILNHDEIDVVRSTIKALAPLRDISEHMSSEKYVTASAILPIEQQIRHNSISDVAEDENLVVRKIMDIICNTLQYRFRDRKIETKVLLTKAMWLDPRFKNVEPIEHTLQEDLIREMMDVPVTQLGHQGVISKTQKKKQSGGLGAIFSARKVHVTDATTDEDACKAEFHKYEKLDECDIDECPLEWWKFRVSTFPRLAYLAKRYLCVQGTSVPSERVFSRGGNIVVDSRTSLTSDHTEELIFLAMNKNHILL